MQALQDHGKPPQVGISSPDVTDGVDKSAQAGVQQVEGITTVWTRAAMITAYTFVWLIYFAEGILAPMQGALNPYITSAFASHSLTPTVGIVSAIIGGCANFTIAKLLDVFGRPSGFLICVVIGTIGLILMAACRSVIYYAAAQVFYTVGNSGLQYSLSVFVADSSSLKNRGLMVSLATSANLITCWLAGPVANQYLNGPGWPWAFWTFSIIIPCLCLPLFGLLQYYSLKAQRLGIVDQQRLSGLANRTLYYLREFDAIGLLLLSAGAALLLLPFNIYVYQAQGWRSPLIICLLVFGLVTLVLFAMWERYLAPVTFIPYKLLSDRTVVGACVLSAVVFFSYTCWSIYYSSFLQVASGLSLTHASYMLQIQTVGNVIFGFVGGAVIRATGNFKHVTLYFALPVVVLGTGLLIFSRQHVNYLIMSQILIASSQGVILIVDEISALAASPHQNIAVVIAGISFSGSVGSAVALTVTSAIWQNDFPRKLAEHLPASELGSLEVIYSDLETQLSYPVGSVTRDAINKAYISVQRDLIIAGTVIWALGIVAILMWRNIDVRLIKQVKGQIV